MKLLTFNCAALPVFSSRIRTRLLRLSNEIRKLDPDIVCLQEVSLESYAELLKARLRRWPHSYWEKGRRGGLLSGALAVFSKRPFREASFTPFKEQGPWIGYAVLARMSKKGFMRLTFEDPRLELIHTHPLADYSATRLTLRRYGKLQRKQVGELVRKVRALGTRQRLVLAGDLNFTPRSESYRLVTEELGLRDLMEGKEDSSMISDQGWKSFWVPKLQARLDYVLVSPDWLKRGRGRARYVLNDLFRWDRRRKGSLSDHCGVLVELKA